MASGGRASGNLPTELTTFVGRRDELAEVRRLLAGSHLVTLTGIGGVGKTRLALRAAAELHRAFPDGVWLMRLDQLREQALVAQAVAGALGLQDRGGCSQAASLAEYLAGRRLLLVLDNCEHLIDAAAKLADQLLRAAEGLRVLATSREALNIDGEAVLPVPPLAAPERTRPLTLAELGLFPAMALFGQRARQAVPGFAVTEANMAAVAGICRRLEGLPLAIELAAAQIRVLSPEQIDDRLSDRLGLLTRGGRVRPARQQTLRASIEWSHQLCSPAERLLWARLSVFAGGFELDAVEEICADHRLPADQVLGLLGALADKSVLIAGHSEGVAATGCRRRCGSSGRNAWSRPESALCCADGTGSGMSSWLRGSTPTLSPSSGRSGRPGCTGSAPTCARPRTSARPSRARPRPGCASRFTSGFFTTGSPGMSARAGTASARRWPGRGSRPGGGRGGC